MIYLNHLYVIDKFARFSPKTMLKKLIIIQLNPLHHYFFSLFLFLFSLNLVA